MNIALVSCCLAKDDLSFPLGLLCIETAMRQDSYINLNNIKLFNSFCSEDPKILADNIVKQGFSLVGLSVYLWNREWMDELVEQIKKINPNIIFFAGGTEVTANYESFDLDLYKFLTLGEGEISTVEALTCFLNEKPIIVEGVRSKENPTTILSFPPDLSQLASPFLTGIADFQISENRSILWEMTRGCPFRCNFCFESRGERSVRSYPKERLEKELDYLIERGVEDVFVLDPTFNVDPKRSAELLDLIISKAPENMHFSFEVRAELLNKDLVDRFSQFFCSLQMGLQSVNVQALSLLNRGFKKQIFIDNINLLNKSNVEFGLDLIIGLPKDDLEGFENSLDFAIGCRPVNIDIFLLAVLPGTVLYDNAKQWGLNYNKKPPYTVIRTQTMNEEDIKKALKLKEACDFFYTEGKACMWFHSLCDCLEMKPSQIFRLFNEINQENDDVFTAQDYFVKEVLNRYHKEDCLKAMLSYMELHQGLVFFQMEGDSPTISLYYDPNQMARLDHENILEFVDEVKPFNESKNYEIFYDGTGELCIE